MKSLSLSKPHMIVVVGIAGAGKSFFATQFAHTFEAPLVSSDYIHRSLTPLEPIETKQAIEVIDSIVTHQIDELMKTQRSIIVDASSDTRAQRLELSRKARSKGYESLLVWVQTAPSIAKARATKPSKLDPRRHLITPEQHDAAVRRFTIPNASEKTIVISGKHTYASQAKIVLTKLAQPRIAVSAQTSPPPRKAPAGRIMIR